VRRLWIVAATVVACAGLAGQTSVAHAESADTHAATSCSDLINKYKNINRAEANVLGQGNPSNVRKYYSNLAKTLNKLASSGPSELHTAFKHLAQYIAKVAKIDFSNPSAIQQAAPQLVGAARQLQPDVQKIAAYFGTVCHYTPPTT